jgi:hypothetical protein
MKQEIECKDISIPLPLEYRAHISSLHIPAGTLDKNAEVEILLKREEATLFLCMRNSEGVVVYQKEVEFPKDLQLNIPALAVYVPKNGNYEKR